MLVSLVENIEEALVQFFLPDSPFSSYADNDKRLIGSRINVHKFAILGLVIKFCGTLWVIVSCIKRVSKSHVHLNLDSGQANVISIVAHNQVLVTIVPEQWMSFHFYNAVHLLRIAIYLIGKPLQVVKLDGDQGASFGVLDLKISVIKAVLQPVVSIELAD